MSGLVLVVGGTKGTGALIAKRLAADGRQVRVMARDPAAARGRLGHEIEIVRGDLTNPETIPQAVSGADAIVFTAGVPSGRPAPAVLVKATDYDGARHTLAAAQAAGMRGRFVYLNSLGVTVPSLSATLLNLLKRDAFTWRRRLEADIRRSGIDYAIIRVGFLTDGPGGRRAIRVTQTPLPLTPWHTIPRADAAEIFATAVDHPKAARATFDIVSGNGPRRGGAAELLDTLVQDAGA
jgi:uncharacterized protein YbjT (DUF2867 family)